MSGDVFERLRAVAGDVLSGEPVLFAYLFGSVARGEEAAGSDVDIALYLEPGVSGETALDLRLRMPSVLSAAAGVSNIEVLILGDAPLRICGRIIRERRVVYSRDESARVRFESLTTRRYLDFQIHALPLDRALLRATAEGRR